MKLIKISILLSVFFGFSSVFAQTANLESNKSDHENKIEQTNPDINTSIKQQVLNSEQENPATAKPSEPANQKRSNNKDEVFVKTRPYPSERDPSREAKAKLKDQPVNSKDNRSEPVYSPANPDPNK